jgi:hypothetical protein
LARTLTGRHRAPPSISSLIQLKKDSTMDKPEERGTVITSITNVPTHLALCQVGGYSRKVFGGNETSNQNCDCIAAEPVKSSLRALMLVGWVGSMM